MVNLKQAVALLNRLPEVTSYDHFGSEAFKAHGRTFATVWHETRTVNFRFNLEQQRHFLGLDGEGFVEIDNAWGRQGWTTAQLEFLTMADFKAAAEAAWEYSKQKTPLRKKPVKKMTPANKKKPFKGKKASGR